MRTIHKYYMHPGVDDKLHLTEGWKFLHFAYQASDVAAWFELETNNPTIIVDLRIIGTGHEVPENAIHLGTAVGSVFVWHLYQLPKKV